MHSTYPSVGPDNRSPLLLSRRSSRLFVLVFLLLAVGAAVLAVRETLRLYADPELRGQLEEVHDRASRREPPSPRTDP